MTDDVKANDEQKQVFEAPLLEKKDEDVVTEKAPSRNFKLHRIYLTSAVAGGFFLFGCVASSQGVSLPTFANNIGVNIDEISATLVARGSGYLSGSLVCGILSKYLSAYTLLVSAVVLILMGTVLIPVVLNIVALFVFTFMNSFGSSAYETIANVSILQMWGVKSEPVLQAAHFCFCVGAAIIPFIMRPFLNEARDLVADANMTSNTSAIPEIKLVGDSHVPLVALPYFMIGFLYIVLITFVLVFVPSSFTNLTESQQKSTIENEGARFRFVMLTFLFFFYFIYIGLEISFNAFLFTFGLSDAPGMKLSKEFSVYLNSVFYFAIVIGQFGAIFLSRKFSPMVILTVDLTGSAVSCLLMVCLPLYGHVVPQLFWVGVGGFGIFRASIYGTTFLWAERYITVNARAASVFIVGGSTGEMILPLPVGLLIERFPLSFLYLNIGYMSLLMILFIAMWKVAETKGQRLKKTNLEVCSVAGVPT